MKTIMLESFEDDSFGQTGLRLPGMFKENTNAVMDGAGMAHDIMEHVNGPRHIGGIDDEFEALGALWYIRAQHGQINRDGRGSYYTLHQNIAADITRMFRDYFYGEHVDLYPRRTRAVTDDSDLQEILTEADKGYRSELDEEDKPEARRKWKAYRAAALARMRIGYAKARRRWQRYGSYHANRLFWAIADAVHPYARSCEYPGQQFRLTINVKEAKAWCEEDIPEDDY